MITCTKVKKELNEALLKNQHSIKVKNLSDDEKKDLEECGYIVKKVKGEFIISH